MSDDPRLPGNEPGAHEEDESEAPPPRLPRGRFFTRIAIQDLFRIAMFAILLGAVIALREPCAEGAAGFFELFDDRRPAARPELHYERLTDEEIRERFGGGREEAASGDPESEEKAAGETNDAANEESAGGASEEGNGERESSGAPGGAPAAGRSDRSGS